MARRRRVIAVPATTGLIQANPYGVANGQVMGGRIRVHGWSLIETGGTSTCNLELRTSTPGGGNPGSGSQTVLAAFIAAGGTNEAWFGEEGIDINFGLYCTVFGSGTLGGSVLIS